MRRARVPVGNLRLGCAVYTLLIITSIFIRPCVAPSNGFVVQYPDMQYTSKWRLFSSDYFDGLGPIVKIFFTYFFHRHFCWFSLFYPTSWLVWPTLPGFRSVWTVAPMRRRKWCFSCANGQSRTTAARYDAYCPLRSEVPLIRPLYWSHQSLLILLHCLETFLVYFFTFLFVLEDARHYLQQWKQYKIRWWYFVNHYTTPWGSEP